MEFGLLQEDIFQKQLWDITAFTNAISSCDKIGTVASMTKLAIHLHTPQFRYMSAYYVRWLLIDKKTPQYIEPPESVTDNCTSLTHFLREHTLKENNVSFRSIHWSQNLVSNHNYAPLLVTLLTDGTVLFVDTCSKTVMQTAFGVDYVPTTAGSDQTHTLTYLEDSSYSVKLRECSISLDCATAYKQYCHKEGLHLFQYRIRCIAEHHLAQSGANLMCFAACDRVTIWAVYHNAVGELQIDLLTVCLIPDCGVDTSVTAVLATTLSTSATSCTVAVVCGTNEGDLVTFELKLTQDSASSVAVGPVYAPAAVTSRLAGRLKVSDAPIDRVQLSAMTDNTVDIFVGAERHSVSIAALLGPPSSFTGVAAIARLFPVGSASAFELLPDLRALTSTNDSSTTSANSTTVPTGVLTSSTTGILSTWTVRPVTTSSSTNNNLDLLEENILNKAKAYPIIGVTSDPTKLVYTYLYKTPAMHSNSREVQLNIALRNPRTALAVSVSPFVVQDFAASVLHTARVLLYVVHAQSVNNTATVKMPLSGLVLAYLQSLETESCKKYYRTLITNLPHDELSTNTNNTPADKSKRKRSNNSANSSDSSENESENEESDIEETASTQQPKQTIFLHKDQQLQKLQQQQSQAKSSHGDSDSEDSSQPRSATKSGQKKKFLASQTRVRNTAKLYNRIEQLARPGSMEVVTLAIGTVFDAAVCVAYSMSNNNHTSSSTGSTSSQAHASGVSMDILSAVDTGVCDVVKEMDLGDKIEVLFSLPTEDTITLDLKRTLWQSLHALLLASHRVRCVSRIGADWEDVPASLRQVMHTAYCYQALRRWLAGTDEATPSSDLQSVYFMSRVLDNDSAAPEAKALALAVQLQLLTYTRGRNSSHSSDSEVLHSLYGAEECGICGCLVDFQPTNDNTDETESHAQKTGPENTVCGASVLYGTCQGCSIRTERCCFSLRLLTTPAHKCISSMNSTANGNGSSSASHSGIVGTQENRVYACPVCTAATSVCLVRTVTAPNSVLRGTTPQALLCPHCAVLMQPL